jgi:[histone H3]-dimethyl-L-lysine9 demethylase
MYNALATTDGKGTLGTTRLHMDMSDAFNVMTFAAPLPDTTDDEANGAKAPGYAVWDIYKASDAGKLRQFLRELHGGGLGAAAGHDPIHAQTYYLDAEQRQLLFERHGVKSHRIFQRPGEGVFIPAGCAHQVRHQGALGRLFRFSLGLRGMMFC